MAALDVEPAAEGRINLGALQQRDPYITDIVDTASQVALYSFNPKQNEWEKTDIEGTLFVYARSAQPINGFMILNRLGLNNQIEPINKDLEFQLQDPFLLYRNSQGNVFGIWFYDKDECARLGQLMNSLVQVAAEAHALRTDRSGRLRRASESDTLVNRREHLGNKKSNCNKVDILQLLSKAQHEYDRAKSANSSISAEPKPMIGKPGCNVNGKVQSPLHKPRALRPEIQENAKKEPHSTTTAINLEALFGGPSLNKSNAHKTGQQQKKQKPRSKSTAAVPLLGNGQPDAQATNQFLQRLMSNPGNMVDEIERQQMEMGGAGDAKNIETSNNPVEDMVMDHNSPPSPATDLKMKLNMIISPDPSSKSNKSTLRTVHSSVNLKSQGSSDNHTPAPPSLLHLCMSESNMLSFCDSSDSTLLSQLKSSYDYDKFVKNGASVANATLLKGIKIPERTTEILLRPDDLTTSSTKPPIFSVKLKDRLSPTAVPPATMPPPASVLMSPMAFQTASTQLPLSAAAAAGPSTGSNLIHSASSQALQQLAAPFNNTASAVSPPLAMEMDTINPLTKEQLQQSLIFMLKNDSYFIDKIHNAYVQSLHKH